MLEKGLHSYIQRQRAKNKEQKTKNFKNTQTIEVK